MPKYTIVLTKKAQKKLDNLSDSIAEPIIQSIAKLENNHRPLGYKKLKGTEAYRIRSGNYRIIYEVIDKILLVDVIDLGHRKDIYD